MSTCPRICCGETVVVERSECVFSTIKEFCRDWGCARDPSKEYGILFTLKHQTEENQRSIIYRQGRHSNNFTENADFPNHFNCAPSQTTHNLELTVLPFGTDNTTSVFSNIRESANNLCESYFEGNSSTKKVTFYRTTSTKGLVLYASVFSIISVPNQHSLDTTIVNFHIKHLAPARRWGSHVFTQPINAMSFPISVWNRTASSIMECRQNKQCTPTSHIFLLFHISRSFFDQTTKTIFLSSGK